MRVVAYVSLYSLVGLIAFALDVCVAVVAGLMHWAVVLAVAVGMAAVGCYWAGLLGHPGASRGVDGRERLSGYSGRAINGVPLAF